MFGNLNLGLNRYLGLASISLLNSKKLLTFSEEFRNITAIAVIV